MNRKSMKIFYSITLLVISFNCYAETDLHVSFLSNQILNSSELGNTQIEGVGDVNLVARKNGNQVIVHALDSQSKTIGKAETVTGVKKTPLYVMSPSGLKKITIIWGSKKP